MAKYVTVTDVTNPGQALSKDHGPNIPAGTELTFEKDDKRVKRLLDLGMIKSPKDAKEDADGGAADPGTEPPDPDALPDDLDALKAIADGFEISYPQNIGVPKLQEKIRAHKEKMATSENPDADGAGTQEV